MGCKFDFSSGCTLGSGCFTKVSRFEELILGRTCFTFGWRFLSCRSNGGRFFGRGRFTAGRAFLSPFFVKFAAGGWGLSNAASSFVDWIPGKADFTVRRSRGWLPFPTGWPSVRHCLAISCRRCSSSNSRRLRFINAYVPGFGCSFGGVSFFREGTLGTSSESVTGRSALVGAAAEGLGRLWSWAC